MEIREDKAWLLRSRFNPLPIPGALSLSESQISFTLDEAPSGDSLEWLSQRLPPERLEAPAEPGGKMVAFEYPLSACEVTWPITGGGSTMIVQAPGRRWVISYDEPPGGAIANTLSMISGRRKAREWKKVLAAAGR